MKILFFLITFTLFSCEDNVSEPTVEIVERPTACTDPNPENPNSEFRFDGIQSVSQIGRTSAKIHWQATGDFSQYLIINSTPTSRRVLASAQGHMNEVLLKGLTPDTGYNILVRAIDKRGFQESNSKTISFTTLPWPTYSNTKSLHFNGAQAVALGASSKFDLSKPFTFALWMKKPAQTSEQERIITFHRGSKASSALSIGLNEDRIVLYYRNLKDDAREFDHKYSYADSKWHQYTLSYDGQFLELYIDGIIAFKIKDELRGVTGKHNAHLAAFTGNQKGLVGLLDEFVFFESYFSSDDVLELYNSKKAFDVREHSKSSSLSTWYRLGDNLNDSEANIEDMVGSRNGTPFNIAGSDFTTDSP